MNRVSAVRPRLATANCSGTIRLVRILQIVGQSHRRGAEMFALELASGLDALGHDNHVVALGLAFDGGRDPDLPALTTQTAMGPRAVVMGAWHLRRLLARDPFDVVLAHGGSAAQAASLMPRSRRPLLIWQRILGFPPAIWKPAQRRWWRFIMRRIDVVVAMTHDIEDESRRLGFTGPIWEIGTYNTRSPQRFVGVDRIEASARLRREVGVDDDVPLLGLVGHLVDQKRPERAIEVLELILSQSQRAHLVVAGDGPLRTRVEREIRERGLGPHVSLIGHRSDVEQVYGGLDVLLLTSDDEGIPGVAVEAQMAGCPVVTFPLGGVDTVVENGRTGVVLARRDTVLMAEHTVRLLQRPRLLHEFGDEARRTTGQFSTSQAADEYGARLMELYEGRRLAARR
jgi:glycosyltransferase involved in cell wall biosynthesis